MNFIDDSPRDSDVYMGKGHGVGSRAGNKEYHAYIVATVPRYIVMKKKAMRSALFREIVNVMKNDQQRRFLKRDAATGRYFEVSESVAQAKVGQAIRAAKMKYLKTKKEPTTTTAKQGIAAVATDSHARKSTTRCNSNVENDIPGTQAKQPTTYNGQHESDSLLVEHAARSIMEFNDGAELVDFELMLKFKDNDTINIMNL